MSVSEEQVRIATNQLIETLYPLYKKWTKEKKGWIECPPIGDIKAWYQWLDEQGADFANQIFEEVKKLARKK